MNLSIRCLMRNPRLPQTIGISRTFMGRRFCSEASTENLLTKINRLQERMVKVESDRSGDFYKYGIAGLGAVLTAAFGANYINKRIDDTKSELREKIDDTKSELKEKIVDTDKRIDDTKSELREKIVDTERHIEHKLDTMEKHLSDEIALSTRIAKLEGKKA